MLTNVHHVVAVAILQHTAGNGSWRVFAVGENSDFAGSLDECSVKLGPRTTRERNDTHVVIGHHQPVSQQLQRVESGIEDNLGIGHLALDRAHKAEEQRVTTGKHHHFVMILLKDRIQRHGDIYPLCILRQKGCHSLMMPSSARENASLPDDFQNIGREKWLWRITNAYNVELH